MLESGDPTPESESEVYATPVNSSQPVLAQQNPTPPAMNKKEINPKVSTKRAAESSVKSEPSRKKPRSFAVHVESFSNMKTAESESSVPKKLGESPALLKTFCKHEISLPPDFSETYDFSAPITETLGGEKVSSAPAKTYKFSLDAFQRESIKCLERRESVLVAAHTSAGKTVVAEYAIAMSLRDNQRVIYTSPIKALSNQKFRELEAEFKDVGLMTGDVTINKNASCLVMTTEILRSMLYRGSEVVREVAWVIFDEVHYMRDKERGVVWEETIILVPKNVRFVFLSATIPNAKEFSEWIAHLKNQPCHTIYTDTRPVPLQHYMFPVGGEGLHLVVDDKGEFRADAFEKVLGELKHGDGSAGGGSHSRKRGGMRSGQRAPGKSDVYKVVKMIKERSMYPVIVFSFSRRDCESMAMQMAKLEFNDDEEKALVEKVYENAVAALNDEDRKLPQIVGILPILRRGVGIHHSGLLPIAKEIVELLFQEGLIKALFATETFAMGLNMPAKTVVFSSIRKYDGTKTRNILGGEYIQMSGRAGRRGQDEKGIAILMCDERVDAAAVKDIMSGTSEPLRSTFHLGYNMLLNLLRAEEADPEYVIARSLAQFQADHLIPETEEKLNDLEKKKEEVDICPPGCTLKEADINAYFKLRETTNTLRMKIRRQIHTPKTIMPFLQSGRVVRVHDIANNQDYGWGAVMAWKRRPVPKSGGEERLVIDVMCRCRSFQPPNEKPLPVKDCKLVILGNTENDDPKSAAHEGIGIDKGEWKLVPCDLLDLDGVSAIRILKPEEIKSLANRTTIGQSVREVLRRFPKGVPMLDPFEDLGIKDKNFAIARLQLEAVGEAMKKSPVHDSPIMCKISRQWRKKVRLTEQLKVVTKDLKVAQGLILKDDLKKMKRVLRRLGFVNEDGIVEVKGRVACEVNAANELVITELLLGGNLNEMSPEVLVSVLSCFVIDEPKKDENLTLEKDLETALNMLRAVSKRVATVMKESNIVVDVNEYVQSFNPVGMRVVYHWCLGKTFDEVCALSDIFEGSVVRCLRRLEELLRQLVSAAKSIGNSELEKKFEAGSAKLKRGIAFQSSLYT